jgi:hypothetical protein
MLYEDRVASLSDLGVKLRTLDQDAGLRLIGGAGKRKTLAFVTRFGPTYTMMTYSVISGGTPGKRLQTLESQDPAEVVEALSKLVKGRLRAWVY